MAGEFENVGNVVPSVSLMVDEVLLVISAVTLVSFDVLESCENVCSVAGSSGSDLLVSEFSDL